MCAWFLIERFQHEEESTAAGKHSLLGRVQGRHDALGLSPSKARRGGYARTWEEEVVSKFKASYRTCDSLPKNKLVVVLFCLFVFLILRECKNSQAKHGASTLQW